MRRITMFNQVSADGYFAASDGSLSWVVQEPDVHKGALQGMSNTDLVLFGRKTHDMFASFWPNAVKEPAPAPHGGRGSDETHAMAVWLNETPKIVFSRTLQKATWSGTRVLSRVDPTEIEALKRGDGGSIILFGSGSIVAALTEHGLIDEYQFVVSPVLLGNGRSLLSGLTRLKKVELLESKAFASGVVMLRYGRAQ
jgi:dihydrofolate reductase